MLSLGMGYQYGVNCVTSVFGPGRRLRKPSLFAPCGDARVPVTEGKLDWRLVVMLPIFLFHLLISFVCLCPAHTPAHTYTHQSISLPRIQVAPSLGSLELLTLSTALCSYVCFLTAANAHNLHVCCVTEKLICSGRILYSAAVQLWHPSTNQPFILE